MDFYEYIEVNELAHLVKTNSLVIPDFKNEIVVFNKLKNILDSRKKILLIGDYDVDGAMCVLVSYEVLKKLGFDVSIYNYTDRTHNLSKDSVMYAIKNKYDAVLVMDTGSNDKKMINMLKVYGIDIIVIDHHKSKDTYKTSSIEAFINSTLEETPFPISAGALVFLVMYKFCNFLGKSPLVITSVYALISLYADCIDMTHPINVGIYDLCQSIDYKDIPVRIRLLMRSYKRLTRRAIEYTISPVINASFRENLLKLLNAYLFDFSRSSLELNELKTMLFKVKEDARVFVNRITDYINIVGIEHYDNFIFFDLSKLKNIPGFGQSTIKNYTGLIANNLASSYKKTSIVISSNGADIKGSLRDPLGRDYLTIFSQVCTAGGHPPAFGFKLKKFELYSFKEAISLIDINFSIKGAANTPIIIEISSNCPDGSLVELISRYNEFSGIKHAPTILLRGNLPQEVRGDYNHLYYSYRWGTYSVESDFRLLSHNGIIMRPIISNKTKLKVQGM